MNSTFTNMQHILQTLMVLRRLFSDDKWSTLRWSSSCWRADDGSTRCWLVWFAHWNTATLYTLI